MTNLYAFPVILIFVIELQAKKTKDNNLQMSYKQGFISGLIITMIVTVLSPLTQWIVSTIITPQYFPNVIVHSLETGYYNSIEEAEAYFNLNNYMVQSAIGAFVMGIITTAIVAFFVRTKPEKER